ncbi:MAG: NUDIX hydrolase [Acidimicrobiia bacterium]|nr:NUDIX hydrolase [Acidimicrobiia bacterium]
MTGFRKLAERTIHEGVVVTLGVGTFAGPDGATFEREVVHHPGAVAVVAVDDAGSVTLVRQYRAAIDDLLLELPAGKLDVAGEAPERTAQRELAEEVGLEADDWEELATFLNSPGFCDEVVRLYLARGLRPVAHDRQGAEELAMTVETLALADVAARVADGTLRDAKTIIGLLTAREHLGVR